MNYVNFCRNYFTVTKIPVSLMQKNKSIYSSLGDLLSYEPEKTYQVFWTVSPFEANPCFCRYSSEIEYGCVHVEGTDYYVILGPTFNVPLTNELVREYMREDAIPIEYREAVTELLYSIPVLSHQQFSNHLSLLHMSLNGKEMDITDLYRQQNPDIQEIKQQQTKKIVANMEENHLHNSYHFEKQLWETIKNGNPDKLAEFLSASSLVLTEGKLASTPLRHTKNLFILSTVKAGMMGAIPSGVDIEKTYQLIDLYIQECEQCQNIEAIKKLEYSMLIDFCRCAGEAHIPEGISTEVYQCITYIRSHTNEPITINDVANHIHKSLSYSLQHFKEELSFNMGAFIMRCKLEEARSLLTYTDKSLAEISNYLCFSNQSYFQQVFKKNYGITPLQYRKQRQRHSV